MILGITATLTILSYALYAVAPQRPNGFVLTVGPVTYCVLRYSHQILVEGQGESPERLLMQDRMMWVGIVFWAVLCATLLYGGDWIPFRTLH